MSDYTPLTYERIHNVLVDNQFILCSSLEMTYMHEKSAKYISFRIEHGSWFAHHKFHPVGIMVDSEEELLEVVRQYKLTEPDPEMIARLDLAWSKMTR